MASKFTLVRGNEYKNGYVGFSWLTLFFSWWVALFRKDWKWFAIMLLVPNVISFLLHFVLSLIMSVVGVSDATIDTVAALVSWLMVTLPSQIYFGYVYNKKYTEKLIREGFKPVDGASAQLVNVKMDNANITNTNASTKGTGVSSLRASLAASKSTDNKTPVGLVKEGFALLERSSFDQAEKFFEKALDINPNISNAYVGALMAEQKCRNVSELVNSRILLEDDALFQKALELANPKTKQILEKYIQVNRARNI